MALGKKTSETRKLAEVLDFFTTEEVQNNLTFLTIADSLIRKGLEKPTDIIKVIDDEDENNVIYYTNDKFLEVMDKFGLDGFIYSY